MTQPKRERWRITDIEDGALQGLSVDAQVIYMRAIRRHMDYETGISTVTYGQMKCVLEYIPDAGSQLPARRVADISNDYIRARLAELERAELIVAQPKRSRFEAPAFRCVLVPPAELRPKTEPQRNPKGGTPSGAPSEAPAMARVSEAATADGAPKEPQRGNPKISGIREEGKKEHSLRSCSSAAPPSDATENAPAVIRLPTLQGEHAVTDADLAEYASLFPALDVLQELRSMRAWLLANPSNRKTARGIKRFIANWLTRSQDRATPARSNHREARQPVDNSAIARVRRANGIPDPGGRIIEGEFRRT